MVRSKIIKNILGNDKSITASLQEFLVLVNELDNSKLNRWIKNELEGYYCNDELPDYRKNLPYRIIYSGINGRMQMTNQPLPLNAFGENSKEIASVNFCGNSILELENNKDGLLGRDLSSFSKLVFKETGIACYKIEMIFGKNVSDLIISNVKTKILESLLILEKEYGNLDSFYIDYEEFSEEKSTLVNNKIETIIFSDNQRL